MNQGTQGHCLPKKTEGRKSRETVLLSMLGPMMNQNNQNNFSFIFLTFERDATNYTNYRGMHVVNQPTLLCMFERNFFLKAYTNSTSITYE
jgi:hypothetical protein